MNNRLFKIIVSLSPFFLLLFTDSAVATEQYAARSGKTCNVCHIDPLGGGGLTDFGKGYAVSFSSSETKPSQQGTWPLFYLAVRFIHIFMGFLWFGTILYVHLILKPAYASKGLPQGEVKLGLVSMGVMAVTGAVLTYKRNPTFSLLLDSKFGILLLTKVAIFLIMAFSALYVVYFIGPKLKKKRAMNISCTEQLTLEQLSYFNGEEGKPAYIGFQGRVYDATSSKLWRNGIHMKRHVAGNDLTSMLCQAPHGEDKITAMPEVGVLSADEAWSPEMPKTIFYFIAYMNLGLVLAILFILALWN